MILLEIGQIFIYSSYALMTQSLIFTSDYIFPGLMTALIASLGTFLLTKAIAVSPLSSVIPFLAFLPFFTMIFGTVLLGEKISLIQFFGLILLVLASLLINYQGKKVNSIKELFSVLYADLTHEKGCILVILTSLSWAIAIPFDKIATATVNPVSHALFHAILCGIIFSVARFFSKTSPWGTSVFLLESSVSNGLANIGLILLGSLNASLAMVLQFTAYQGSYVGLVEAGKRAVSLIANLFLGAFLFKEAVNKFKILGTLLILIATVLLLK